MLEMHTAIQLGEDCELTILMPPEEEERWTMSVINGNGLQVIYKTLREASITTARASVEADRSNILRLVEGQGILTFDDQVKKHLQGWFLHAASAHVKELPLKMLEACAQVGKLLSKFSALEEATSVLNLGMTAKGALLDWQSASSFSSASAFADVVGDLWHEKAWLQHKRGQRDDAVDLYSKGLEELDHLAPEEPAPASRSRLYRGRARAMIGDEADELFVSEAPPPASLEQACQDYQASLEILQKKGLEETEDGAKLYNNLGLVHSLRSDFATSARMFESAGRIRELTATLQTPMNARRLYNLGSMRLKQGRTTGEEMHWEHAEKHFKESLTILQECGLTQPFADLCRQKLEWMA
ncbi:unnamed protein product, partial [Symbiodinium pilosum]